MHFMVIKVLYIDDELSRKQCSSVSECCTPDPETTGSNSTISVILYPLAKYWFNQGKHY